MPSVEPGRIVGGRFVVEHKAATEIDPNPKATQALVTELNTLAATRPPDPAWLPPQCSRLRTRPATRSRERSPALVAERGS